MDLENLKILEIQDINFPNGEEDEEMQIRAPKRYIRDNQNPFEFFNEWEFKRRFRFSKNSVMFGILPLIEERLAKMNNPGLSISPLMQLMICLRFYSTASFQLIAGDVLQVSQSTISRIIFRISILIASYINRYIKIPTSKEVSSENRRLFKESGFADGVISFPCIDGAIDCTHIRLIHSRFQNIEEIYRNKKGYFSLNVQAVIGPRTEFLE